MKLPFHGRSDYSAIVDRADYSWPGGKRLAAHVAVNIEHFAFGRGETGMVPTGETPPPDHRTSPGATTGCASACGASSISWTS